jgi:threonine/homoserine/homoserine lactone efflux protein
MWTALLEGLAYGLFLSILIGPLLTSLVDTSLKYGVKKGIALAIGIWISDFIIVGCLLYFGTQSRYNISDAALRWMAIIASISFLSVGILYVLKANNHEKANKINTPDTYVSKIVKGFLINTVNPFTFVFWTTLATSHIVISKYETNKNLVFFTTILFVIVLTDTMKVFLASKLSYYLNSKNTLYIKYFSGLVFIATGIYIWYKFLLNH